MADFVKAAATAKRLVEANGREVVLFKRNRTPDNAAEPWRGVSGVPTAPEGGLSMTVTMSFVPHFGSGFGKMVTDDGSGKGTQFDQIGLLASTSLPAGRTFLDVEQCDTIRDGDNIWKVERREHLRPADDSILFALGLKR